MVDQDILNSIKQYLDQGVGKDSIKKALMDSGRSEKGIDNAFEKITGQKTEKTVPEEKVGISNKKKIFFIAGGILLFFILAFLVFSLFFKVGFSEDIPDDLIPLGKFDKFINGGGLESGSSLALLAKDILKNDIQNGKVNLIMTNGWGTKIIDAIGLVVENGEVIETSLKIENPSLDVKFTEKVFDNLLVASEPKPVFLKGFITGKIKLKAYDEESKAKFGLLKNIAKQVF